MKSLILRHFSYNKAPTVGRSLFGVSVEAEQGKLETALLELVAC
jgi:hypothetical protein